MTHGSEWDMEIWRPEVENVTRGRPWTTVCHTCVCFFVWQKKQIERKQKQRRIYLTGICHPGWPWSGEHIMIMRNVTWWRFDQSPKQLIVGHTTTDFAPDASPSEIEIKLRRLLILVQYPFQNLNKIWKYKLFANIRPIIISIILFCVRCK